MSKNQKPYGKQSSSRDFLVCKTDSALKDKPVKLPPVGLHHLAAKFPYMLKGKAFIDDAILRLEESLKFAAMLVRIDDFSNIENEAGKDYAAKILVNTANSINISCKDGKGLWGLIERDMFGCFLPEKNDAACKVFAESIQEHFSAYNKETLSIGISAYPLAQFNRIQTIRNARKALDHAALSGPCSTQIFNAVTLNISGDGLYQQGNVNGAVGELKTALLLDPSNMNIHNSLGVCYGILGALKSAINEFEAAAMLAPDEVMPVYNAGLVCMKMNQDNKALKYFLKACEIGKNVFESAFQAGRLYMKMGKREKAREYFKKALEINPESGAAFRHLGECCAMMGLMNEAVEAYKKAIKQNPNDGASLSALGCLFDELGENPEIAITFCRHSIEVSPESSLFHQRLGKLYLKQNLHDEALKEFEHAQRLASQ